MAKKLSRVRNKMQAGLQGHSFLQMLELAYHAGTKIRLGNEFQAVKLYDRISGPHAIEHRFLLDRCVISIVERPEEEL